MTSIANRDTAGTTSIRIALAWAVVGVPLAWGVYHTLLNAAKLLG